jgi:DNA-binding transcriptional ArsR family regulator
MKAAHVLTHPIRAEILGLLAEMEAAPDEVRHHLPCAPSQATVAYHLTVLERAGLIERVGGVYRLR